MAGIEPDVLTDRLVSHAKSLGVFDQINEFPGGSAPTGLSCAIWNQSCSPARGASGLKATTIRLEYTVQLRHKVITAAPEMIDPRMIRATSRLMAAYSGDFSLGATVKNIDLLGAHGEPLGYQAGFIDWENDPSNVYRVITITVPLIINDVFEQVKEGSA